MFYHFMFSSRVTSYGRKMAKLDFLIFNASFSTINPESCKGAKNILKLGIYKNSFLNFFNRKWKKKYVT